MSVSEPGRKVPSVEYSCPVCGTVLDDEGWCGNCERHVSNEEIRQHEETYGEIWVTGI